MIHISKIHNLVEAIPEFSISFVKKNGELVHIEKATCASFHSEGRTMNLRCVDSNEFRKVIRDTIIEFNGEEVFL